MIKILIVEDNQNKSKNICSLMNSITEVASFHVAPDIINAKKYLSEESLDLLILDLQIPLRFGDDPKPTNGIEFLKEISKSIRLKKPYHIVGLTEHSDLIETYKSDFEYDLWSIIPYSHSDTRWEDIIKNKIEYLVQSKRSLKDTKSIDYSYDLAILTALQSPELDAVFNLADNWESFKIPGDSYTYHKNIFRKKDKNISVVIGAAPQMGMVATSVMTMKMIEHFRPKYIGMSGITGGVEGIGNIGDIVAAEIVFDYESGKTKQTEVGTYLEPDFKSININSEIKDFLMSMKTNKDLFFRIKKEWKGDKPDTELKLIIGPLASGGSVVESTKLISDIKKHSRKLVGVDMETYGIFYAATNCTNPKPKGVFSFKSISDFANSQKNDSYQKYSSYTSASFLYHFVLDNLF